MSIKSELKTLLEMEFDLPFKVSYEQFEQEPCYIVTPAESHGHLFDLILCFKNKTRLEMEFRPQKYAAEMVREMGRASDSQRAILCAYAKRLLENGAKSSLRINDTPQLATDYALWPTDWNRVLIKSSVRPIEYDSEDKPDYLKTLQRWLPVMMGMSLSLLNVVKVEKGNEDSEGFVEGRKYDVITTRYERNSINRILCLSKYGYSCQICGINFEKKYGKLGTQFIHVHHIIPVSQIGEGYVVNPEKDLIPVCPNCHAMLHRTDPPLLPEDLIEIIKKEHHHNKE